MCHNHGTCLAINGKASCICKAGFTGQLCEITASSYQFCKLCILENTITCKPQARRGSKCLCKLGWKGKLCSQPNLSLLNATCKNGGTRLNILLIDKSRLVCGCKEQYYGTVCQHKKKDIHKTTRLGLFKFDVTLDFQRKFRDFQMMSPFIYVLYQYGFEMYVDRKLEYKEYTKKRRSERRKEYVQLLLHHSKQTLVILKSSNILEERSYLGLIVERHIVKLSQSRAM